MYNKALNVWFLGKLVSLIGFPESPDVSLNKHQESREKKLTLSVGTIH